MLFNYDEWKQRPESFSYLISVPLFLPRNLPVHFLVCHNVKLSSKMLHILVSRTDGFHLCLHVVPHGLIQNDL